MSKKMIWGLATLLILIITATVWVVLHNRAYIKQLENDLAGKQEIKEDRDKPSEQVNKKDLDTSHPDFHVHEDGTPHIGTHDEPSAAVPFQPSVPAFSNFTPDPNDDPVTTAYKRLDYIKNNLHEWGNFSPRTLEIMDELTPMREPPKVEGDGGDTIAWLKELSALRDPRSAELLIKYQMESGIMGRPVDDALVAMGPASLPGLITRLDDLSGDSHLITPLDLVVQIVGEHRSALGGIVEYIIIPKFEAIAASDTVYQHAASWRLAQLRQ